jgi:dTDP-glucose 4,6-dehydratase
MKLLVTGGCGFIGFNFIRFCLKKNIQIINVDNLSYSANAYAIKFKHKNYSFFKLNIGDKKKILDLLINNKVLNVINFAAQTHVDRSINRPFPFIKNNINDFVNFLHSLNTYYSKLKKKKLFRFIQISTDEVYGSLKKNSKQSIETDKYFPNNPYSSSKACSEFMCRSWNKTYNFPVIITNCSNNYGPYQNYEKFIPMIVKKAIKNESINIYGDGKNIRDWIHVEDHCNAVLLLLKLGKVGENYNIGSNNEISNIEMATLICKIMDSIYPSNKNIKYSSLIKYVKDRPGHDFRYSVNPKKIFRETGWKAKIIFNKGLRETIKYYINEYKK